MKEVMRETRNRVRVGNREGEIFWTARGVRQECPLSLVLFNILLADMEEELARRGVKLGEGRCIR